MTLNFLLKVAKLITHFLILNFGLHVSALDGEFLFGFGLNLNASFNFEQQAA